MFNDVSRQHETIEQGQVFRVPPRGGLMCRHNLDAGDCAASRSRFFPISAEFGYRTSTSHKMGISSKHRGFPKGPAPGTQPDVFRMDVPLTRASPATRQFEICNFQFAIFNNLNGREDLALEVKYCKLKIVN